MLSPAAEKEFQEMAQSASFRRDMETVRVGRLHAFVKDGVVDVDAYIDFVTEFNEFIGHEPKPFRQIIDKDMRL
jgi:hypothetical protein